MRYVLTVGVVGLVVGSAAWAGDFAQWRGPQRNGLVADGPPLADSWPKDGPAKLWQSEEIAGAQSGGFGCVSVADGRAYVFCNRKYREPITTRTLTSQALRQLGGFDVKPPAEVVAAVEQARVSPEREKLVGNPLSEFIKKWVEDNLKADAERKQFGPFVTDRLQRGKKALPLDVLDKLAAVKDKTFDDQAALDRWLAESGLADEHKAALLKAVPTTVEKAHDVLFCLDAATGKTLWQKQYDGKAESWSASGTPTVQAGRCYFAGSEGTIYCLDASSGREVWKARPSPGLIHSSVLVADGLVVALAGHLTALNASDGSEVWKQPKVAGRDNSPVLWSAGQTRYVLCNTARDVACVELKTGRLVWTAPGGGQSTVAVVGDHMVVLSGRADVGLTAYKLSEAKAEKLWSLPEFKEDAASPVILGDHVYAVGMTGAACVELASGKVAWQTKDGANRETSPVAADGKLFVVLNKGLLMLRASPEKYDVLAKLAWPVSEYCSPAIADGKLYLRMQKHVACHDLTSQGTVAEPPGR